MRSWPAWQCSGSSAPQKLACCQSICHAMLQRQAAGAEAVLGHVCTFADMQQHQPARVVANKHKTVLRVYVASYWQATKHADHEPMQASMPSSQQLPTTGTSPAWAARCRSCPARSRPLSSGSAPPKLPRRASACSMSSPVSKRCGPMTKSLWLLCHWPRGVLWCVPIA